MPGYLLAQSDARTIPLPDKSVQCVITSPPYFGLRDYSTGRWEGGDDPACDHLQTINYGSTSMHRGGMDGYIKKNSEMTHPYRSQCRKCGARRIDRQIGLEDSISEYVDVMVRVFREVQRVLRDDGTLWLNMGDAMSAGKTGRGDAGRQGKDGFHGGGSVANFVSQRKPPSGLAPKNLLGMPWRIAFALQQDGWVLRSDIIWSKANPMPESVTDRPTKSHEYLFLLSKQERYWYDAEAVREPPSGGAHSPGSGWNRSDQAIGNWNPRPVFSELPAGRNLRSVWTLPTESWPGAHFATFPRKLVEPCVKAGSSERGCCPRCGAGWVRLVEREVPIDPDRSITAKYTDGSTRNDRKRQLGQSYQDQLNAHPPRTTGWHASCQCPPHAPVPAIILDPFAGSGTTLVVANALGRHGIGLDLSREYLTNQAQRRLDRPHAPHIRPARVEPAMPLFGDIDDG